MASGNGGFHLWRSLLTPAFLPSSPLAFVARPYLAATAKREHGGFARPWQALVLAAKFRFHPTRVWPMGYARLP
jgi:hypothetical protein